MSVTITKATSSTWAADYAKIDSLQRAKEAEIDGKDIAPDQKKRIKADLGSLFDSIRTDFLVLTVGLPYDRLLQAKVEERFAHSCTEVDRKIGSLMREVERAAVREPERKASGESLAARVSSIERPSRSQKEGGFASSTFSEKGSAGTGSVKIGTPTPLQQITHILEKNEKDWHAFAGTCAPGEGSLLRARVSAMVKSELEDYKREYATSSKSLSGDEALLQAHRSSDRIHASMREFHKAFQDLAPESRGTVKVSEGGKGVVIRDSNNLVVVGDGIVVTDHRLAPGGRIVVEGRGNIVSSGGRGNVISSKVT